MTTVVLGAGGFIGSAVMTHLASRVGNDPIGMVRTNCAARELTVRGIAAVVGDVNDRPSLHRALSGASSVISCVSYVGNDEQQCVDTNQRGIWNVASIARAVGVERLIYVSTAAVYGPGPFREWPVGGAPLRPVSPASRTRVAAEQYVRDAGGLVIRPNLVYGPGDRWFLPTLTRIVARLGAVIDGGNARLSVVDVDRLASSICRLAAEKNFRHGETLHVNNPEPVRVLDVLTRYAGSSNWTLPQLGIARDDALRNAPKLGLNRHQVEIISTDHWYRSRLY